MNWAKEIAAIESQLDGQCDAYQVWYSFLDFTHNLHQISRSSNKDLAVEITQDQIMDAAVALQNVALRILNQKFFSKLWLAAVQSSCIKDTYIAAIKHHRTLSNLMYSLDLSVLGFEEMRLVLLESLYSSLRNLLPNTVTQSSAPSKVHAQIRDLLSSLDRPSLKRLVVLMLRDPDLSINIILGVTSEGLLTLLSLLLPLHPPLLPSSLVPNKHLLVSKIMWRAVQGGEEQDGVSAQDIVEKTLLVLAHTSCATPLLEPLRCRRDIVGIFELLVTIVGDKKFLQRGEGLGVTGNVRVLAYVIANLLPSHNTTQSHSQEHSPNSSPVAFSLSDLGPLTGLPLEVLLTHSLSTMLECGGKHTRDVSMALMKKWGKIEGVDMDIKGIDDLDDNWLKEENPTPQPSNVPSSAPKHTNTPPGGESEQPTEEDEDSDLEPYVSTLQEREGWSEIDRKVGGGGLRTPYLRVCMEMLRTNEKDPYVRAKHQAALEQIPRLLGEDGNAKATALDAPQYTPLLFMDLVHLRNEFNIEHFEALRMRAAVSLLVCHPLLVTPLLPPLFLSSEVSVGMKREMLVWMRKAAEKLAIPSSVNTLDTPIPAIKDDDHEDRLGKVTIKKPLTLRARSTSMPSSSINRFHEVGGEFFMIILVVLAHLPKGWGDLDTIIGGENKKKSLIQEINPNPSPSASSTAASTLHQKASKLEGIDALLPLEALLTLPTLLQAFRMAPNLYSFAYRVIEVAQLYRHSADLELRRASLCATYIALTCANDQCLALAPASTTASQSSSSDLISPSSAPALMSPAPYQPTGALDSLLHITAQPSSSPSTSSREVLQQLVTSPTMVNCLEELVKEISVDMDQQCREVGLAIIRLCQQILD